VALRDRTTIAFASAQAMVDAIWADMDLRYLSCRGEIAPACDRHTRLRQSVVPLFAGTNIRMVPAARNRSRHEHNG
jgi:hypothetical protein